MTAETLVSKLWNYCNVLRNDGLSYGDYVELRGRTLVRGDLGRGLRDIEDLHSVVTSSCARAILLHQLVLPKAFHPDS